jgi:hypothetical protein
MKQIELTSKLVLAILGLTSVSAIIVPTYATTIPNNTTSFDDIGNGQSPSEEDIRNLVSGAITDAIQLKVVAISSPIRDIQPNSGASFTVECPQGMFATGGGFSTNGEPVDVALFQPELSGGNGIQSGDTPDEWNALLSNPTEAPISANLWVVCVGLGQ